MKESIKTTVFTEDENKPSEEVELDFELDGDVITIKISGNPILSGDWSANFAPLFIRALDKWDVQEMHADQ